MNDEIHALRRVAQILARVSTPIERQHIARRVEEKAKGDDSELAFTLPHAAALFWPGDAMKTAEVLQQMARAFEAGELGHSELRGHRRILFPDLTVWPDCPPMAADSPLRYWVPDAPEKPQAAQLEDNAEDVAVSTQNGYIEMPSDIKALPISRLGYILASARHDPESDDETERIIHASEMIQFDKVIQNALHSGRLQPRAPGTCSPMNVISPSSVVTVKDLSKFLDDNQIDVQIRRIDRQEKPQADEAAPVINAKAKPRTWWGISSAYIVEVMQAGQYATCKELYRALEAKAGPNSPFDKGTGAARGSLFVREIAQPLSLKTIQNNWQKLRELAKK